MQTESVFCESLIHVKFEPVDSLRSNPYELNKAKNVLLAPENQCYLHTSQQHVHVNFARGRFSLSMLMLKSLVQV